MRSRLAARLAALCGVLVDVVRGAAGADAYDHYLAHLSRHHPERTPQTREEFFRRELVSRWDGVRRCC